MLRDKFTSFMFPRFYVSVAGALMKCKPTHLGFSKARFDSDVAIPSNGELSNYQHISAVRFVPASQISLLWRSPWTYTTSGRAYASAAESRKREIRISDEVDNDDDGDAEESSEFEEGSDIEDEQLIEDSDDDDEEEDQQIQSQGLAKKKLQIKQQKSERPEQQGRLLNENITARTIRLVSDDGHRIVSRDEALSLAKGKKMDLVLVDGTANPPVCKVYDFNKEEYKQEQVLKDRKKKKGDMARLNEVKELRFNSKTEPKDLKMKVEKAKEFMNRGYRVKFVAIFKGRPDDEIKRLQEEKMIDGIFPMMEDVAAIEQGPKVESRQAWVMVRHVKFAKKKTTKCKPQISATKQVESEKQEDLVFSEPVFFQGQEENILHAQNVSSISEAAAMGRSEGYPSKLTSPSTKPFAFQSPHSQVQPPPPQDIFETFSSEVYSPPVHGFPQDKKSFQGYGGLEGSERAVSPPPRPLPSISTSQRAGVQGIKIQSWQPSVSPLPASSLQGNRAQMQKPQSPPLDGMSPPQSEQHPSHAPKVQMFSMPSQSPGTLSQKQFCSNDAPRPAKAIGSVVTQGEYPAVSCGRGVSLPNQSPPSLFSPTPPTSLQGSPSNLQAPLLNFSQSAQMAPVTHMHGPSNLRGPPPNASPSASVTLSLQGGLSNLESPFADAFPSPPPATLRHAPSSSQGSHPDPSPSVASQYIRDRYSSPLQGSEGLSPQGVPQYPPSPLQGPPPRGVPRHPPPPIGQPRYSSPLGQPNFQDFQRPQGEFALNNQNQQSRGPDFMHQMQSQLRPALDAAAQDFSQQQNYRLEQGQDRYAPAPNLFGSSQRPQQGPPNAFRSPQIPQQGPPNQFGTPIHPQQGAPNLFRPPQRPQQEPPSLFGSPQRPQQGPPNRFGSAQTPQQGPPNVFGNPERPQQGLLNLFGPAQRPQQEPASFFGSPQRPQEGPPNFVGSPHYPQQRPPNLFESPLHPQQGPPSPFGSPLHPQQRPPNAFGSPPRPQQEPSNVFGSQPYLEQGPDPSQNQFGYQPVNVPQGPRQGPWLSQQAPPRHPSPMPSHPQQTGQPPSQSHQGYFAQNEADGGGQNYGQSQASQGYPPQQYQAPQGYPPQQYQAPQGYPPQQYQAPQAYPPQRGFPQTRLAQGAVGFQGNHTQNQASQQPPPPRGFPQAQPVVPSPPRFRPAWSSTQSQQEYSPLFESPSDKS